MGFCDGVRERLKRWSEEFTFLSADLLILNHFVVGTQLRPGNFFVGNVVPESLCLLFIVERFKLREERCPNWFFCEGEVQVCDAGDFGDGVVGLCL